MAVNDPETEPKTTPTPCLRPQLIRPKRRSILTETARRVAAVTAAIKIR